MDRTPTLDKSKQMQQSDTLDKASSNFVSNETVSHMRKLILNANITITAASSQQKIQQQIKEEIRDPGNSKCLEIALSDNENDVAPAKKQKISIDTCKSTGSFNPLTSLPLSLISNGTLSVTSHSACVAIENGIPILKEINDAAIEKQMNISGTTVTPVPERNSSKAANSVQQNSHMIDENLKYSKGMQRRTMCTSKDLNDNKEPQPQDKLSINKIILKALKEVAREHFSLGKIGLIPNPNQMYFITLLGLEIVVDSCCYSNEIPKNAETISNYQKPLCCGQCHTDFTPNWHFYKNPVRVLCDRCFSFNEHQVWKAAQTVRLAEEYKKYFHLKRKADVTQNKTEESLKKSPSNATSKIPVAQQQFSPPQEQNRIFQNYIISAGLCMKDNSVSGLTALGASIATNPEIFEAAKIVNSLGSTATPLSRAKAVQNFQIALFKGLHQKLSVSTTWNDTKTQKQPLLSYQTAVAEMKNDANVKILLTGNENSDSHLASLLRAVESQHQSLLKTILKQMPKSFN